MTPKHFTATLYYAKYFMKRLTAMVSKPHTFFTSWMRGLIAWSKVVVPQVFSINLSFDTNMLLSLSIQHNS